MTDDPRAAAPEDTPCPKRDDGQHCNCWYDGETCCACGDGPSATDDPRAAAFEQVLDVDVLIDSAEHANEGNFHAARAVLVAALLKAAPPAEGPTWQPIETVRPTSGESLLFFSADGDGPFVGWKNDAGSVFAIQEPCSVRRDATHWMPLPTPPRDPAGKE